MIIVTSGNSALHVAIQWNHNRESIPRLLIENGADLNVINRNGLSPLDLAIDGGEQPISNVKIIFKIKIKQMF